MDTTRYARAEVGWCLFAVPQPFTPAPGRQAHRAHCCALTLGYIYSGKCQEYHPRETHHICLFGLAAQDTHLGGNQATNACHSQSTPTCHATTLALWYVEPEQVMTLSRRVKADVQSAIRVKDDELEKMVATMGEEELRVLADFGPTGMEDINLWKRDRRKLSWRRLSAFGVVRNDPSLYRQWKQQQHQRVASQAEGRKTASNGYGEMLGTTCATDVKRRQPWSTDLHYTHKCRAQQKQIAKLKDENEEDEVGEKRVLASTNGRQAIEGTAHSGRTSRKCVHTAPSSRNSARLSTSTRPASAPLGPAARIATRPSNQSATSRTPSLAKLARVFYQSSVVSTTSVPCESSSYCQHARQNETTEYVAHTAQEPPGTVHLEATSGPETHDHEVNNADDRAENMIVVQGRGTEDRSWGKQNKSDLGGAEKRMESVRLLWAVSQLSADAVTKKVMHGYSERQRAREPNRTRWKTPSRRPQPPTSHFNAKVANHRKKL